MVRGSKQLSLPARATVLLGRQCGPVWLFSFQEHVSGRAALVAEGGSKRPHRTTTLDVELLL